MNTLRAARMELGFNLSEAAHRVGTNIGNLSRIERGRQFPSPPLALRLCQIYGVSLDDIYRTALRPRWRDAGQDDSTPVERAA